MKNQINRLLVTAFGVLGLVSYQNTLADSASCTGACTTTDLPVTFSIVIPSILRFTVGAAGTNPDVQWATAVTGANIGTGSVNADTVTNGGGTGGTVVDYSVLSNRNANVTLTATGSAASFVSGANTLAYTTVGATASGTTGAAVALPVPGTPTVLAPSAGIVNRVGTWQYTYSNATIPASGTYTGTINYTASQP